MTIKNLFASTIVAAVAVTLVSNAQAQQARVPVVSGAVVQPQQRQQYQQQIQYQPQQLTKEQLNAVGIGAMMYDTGSSLGVRSVYSNGPAQVAGIQSGDTITKANGQPIQNLAAFNKMVGAMAAGSSVKLTFTSQGKEKEADVKPMTMAQIFEASNVPEPTAFDQAVTQAKLRIAKINQQIKNTEEDLNDLKKLLAEQTAAMGDLQGKADAARKKMEAAKMEAAAKARAATEAARNQ